jgi:hypothetical protein
MFSISTSSSKHPFFIYSMFFAADDMICSCGGVPTQIGEKNNRSIWWYLYVCSNIIFPCSMTTSL